MRCVMAELATGDYLPDHSGGGLRINFLLPTQVAALLGTKVGFTASVAPPFRGLRSCLGPGLFRAIP